MRGDRNKRLQKLRSELTERSFAHLYETGGMRRVHLQGRQNILKRLLVHAAGFNLSLILRKTMGVGKPRRLQGLCLQLFTVLVRCFLWLRATCRRCGEGSDHVALQSRHKAPMPRPDSGIYQVTYLRLAA